MWAAGARRQTGSRAPLDPVVLHMRKPRSWTGKLLLMGLGGPEPIWGSLHLSSGFSRLHVARIYLHRDALWLVLMTAFIHPVIHLFNTYYRVPSMGQRVV